MGYSWQWDSQPWGLGFSMTGHGRARVGRPEFGWADPGRWLTRHRARKNLFISKIGNVYQAYRSEPA